MLLASATYNPYILVAISLLLLISVIASKASEWLGVPALLVFLVIGMLAGSEGPGGVWFDNVALAQMLGSISLAYILFSGGLDTNWKTVRPVLGRAAIMATIGVLLTAVLVAVFAFYVLGFSWREGMLLGAVMSSTDAAAVFSMLRSRNISLKGRLQPLLELESGSNDPMAVYLTVTMVMLLMKPELGWWTAIANFFWQMLVGAGLGVLFGKGLVYLINRVRLEYEGLYPVLTLAFVLFAYSFTDMLGGNGFLAVYIAGIFLGNAPLLHKRSLMRFHNGIAWLNQIAMFLTMGLLVFPSRLVPVIGSGLLLALFLMFAARPVAVMICLFRSEFSFREKILISWVGLRGAVPIVMAMFPLVAGTPRAQEIFNLVFFIVIASVLLQGKFLPIWVKWLKLNNPIDATYRPPLEFEHTEPGIGADLSEVIVSSKSGVVGKRILELNLPPGMLIALIRRNGKYFIPNGGTVLEANDRVLALGGIGLLRDIEHLLGPQYEPAPERGS